MTDLNPPYTDLDRAVSGRLDAISRLPIDTSRLEPRLEAALRGIPAAGGAKGLASSRLLKAGIGIAALLAVCVTMAIFVFSGKEIDERYTTSEVVLAHERFLGEAPLEEPIPDMCDSHCRCRDVRTEAARIPELGDHRMQCCCVTPFADCRAACLHFEHGGVPVTMAVAKKAQLNAPDGSRLTRDGRSFTAVTEGPYQILALSDADGSFCFVSELPRERLLGLAAGIAGRVKSVHADRS